MKTTVLSALTGALFLLALTACGEEESTGGGLRCGPGTIRSGSVCVPVPMDPGGGDPGGGDPGGGDPGGGDPGGGDPGGGDPMMHDGGMPPGDEDAGSDFSPEPPGGGSSGSGTPGCDESMGECTMWAADLVAALNASRPAGCARMLEVEPRIAEVALRHATHQATIDRLTADSPDGSLFDQISEAGVVYMQGAVLFSVTRLGAEDAMARWMARDDTRRHLNRCDMWVGAGFATGESGQTYVTVLFASP